MSENNDMLRAVKYLPHVAPEYKNYEDAYIMAMGESYPVKYIIAGKTKPFPQYKNKRPPTKKHLIFEYVISGKGYIFLGDTWHTLKKGNMYIVGKDDERNFYSDREDPMNKIWVTFSSEYIDIMLLNYGISSGVYTVDTLQYFENIYNISKSTLSQKEKILSVAENLHSIILAVAAAKEKAAQPLSIRIENELASSVYSKVTLDEIAARLFMSRANLIRTYKKYKGITPYQFILDQKIEIAKALLSTTELSVKSISEKLCFADEHYFSYLFKQKVGLSPLKYKAKKRSQS